MNLSKYFQGIAAKRLSQVEIRPDKSNQHEFNATQGLKTIFGVEKREFKATFIYLNDDDAKIVNASGKLTWYDARENHETRTEYRFYYTRNTVIEAAQVDDIMVIGRTSKDTALVIIAPRGSTAEEQLLWLFGIAEVKRKFVAKDFSEEKKDIGFAGKYILSTMNIEVEEQLPQYLELILKRFGKDFPTTLQFSLFAREIIKKELAPIDAPDYTLLKCMETEQMLFKTLERHLVEEKLKKGFGKSGTDVDDFVKFSLSVQNRRKSRAGAAFENHIDYILAENKLRYSKKAITENGNEPDFIFPGEKEYKDENFAVGLLTMLGLKTSVKERWRQVLPEADRIWPKHLATMEPAISKKQTDQMKAQRVQLVIPSAIIETFTKEQQTEILSMQSFVELVKDKEKRN